VDDQSGVLKVVLPGAVEEVQLKKIAATTTFKTALKSYGNLRRDRQRNRRFFSGLVRGESRTREGSKILTFLFGPLLVCAARS
jgi:hypothetical protein